jgi:TPR repeat protein
VKYFKHSVDLGSPDAMKNYAQCLENGNGCEKNLIQAANYYQLSADLGNTISKQNYSRCLKNGIGCQINISLADKYSHLLESIQ